MPASTRTRRLGWLALRCPTAEGSGHGDGNCVTICFVTFAGSGGGRFLDRGRPLAMYSDLIHVVCPGCGGRAVVVSRPGLPELRYYSELQFRPRRLVCPACGTSRDWAAQRRNGALVGVALGGPSDPFFGLPLWLQTQCCGQLLWAYNGRHLDALQSYIGADVRERTGPTMGMLDRLPSWMKKASNRHRGTSGHRTPTRPTRAPRARGEIRCSV